MSMEITRSTKGFKSWIPTREFFKEMRSFFWLGVLISILGTINSFADTFILGNVGDKALAAAFATDTIVSFADGAISGLAMAFMSILSKKLNTGKLSEAQDGMDLLFFVTFVALIITGLILGFCAKQMLSIFKVHNEDALDYYYIMLASTFIYGYSSVVAQPINATSDFKRTAIISLVVLLSNVVISVPLVYSANLGLIGAAIGSIASFSFSMLIKIYLVKSKFGKEILIAPWRMFFARLSHLKIIKKTWFTFLTEIVYSASAFITNMILASKFLDGAAIIAIAGVFFSIISRLANSGGPYQKYLGKDLEEGNIERCKQHGKGITISVIIRTLPFALLMMVFAIILPYTHLYKVDDYIIYQARDTIFAFMLMIPTLPLMMYGMNQAMIGGRPTITMIVELVMTWGTILALYVAGIYIDSIFWAVIINSAVFSIGAIFIYISGSRPRNFHVETQQDIEPSL